jgi:hypothetical protein
MSNKKNKPVVVGVAFKKTGTLFRVGKVSSIDNFGALFSSLVGSEKLPFVEGS